MQVVYQSERYEIDLHNPHHPNLVVTFDYWERGKTGLAPSRPLPFIAVSSRAELRIRTRDNDWFLSDELEALMQAVSETAGRYAHVINYGSSMGGFGALLFSKASRARAVYIISPQYSIDRTLVPFEKRWAEEAAALSRQAVRPETFGSPDIGGIMVFDPTFALDRLQADLIERAFPRITPLKLSFAGHPAVLDLWQAGVIGTMGRDIVKGTATAQSIRALQKSVCRDSGRYWCVLGEAAGTRRPDLARNAFRKVLSLASATQPNFVFRACAGLSELGDHSGLSIMREIHDSTEQKPPWWSKALRRAARDKANTKQD